MDAELFENVGRNDPCPCGSGKKYKKCHFQKEIIRRQTEESTAKLSDFVGPGQAPYVWWKAIKMIVHRRDWSVLFDAFQPDSAITTTYPEPGRFVEAARVSSTCAPTGGEDYELRRFHVSEEFMFVMGVRGLDNRRTKKLEYEVIATVMTEGGYRITEVETLSVERTDELKDPLFSAFKCFEAVQTEIKARPFEAPKVMRWTKDGPPMPELLDLGDVAASAPPTRDDDGA